MVAVITGDLVRYGQAMRSVANLHAPGGSHEFWKMANNVATSINEAFQATLANPDFEWCWLMGDDHTFVNGSLLSLLDRNVDAIIPLCLNRFPPFDPTIIKDGKIKRLEDLPPEGLYELQEGETCGDAGLLIRRHVLEAIGAPWYDRLRSGSLGVDDQCFVERVKKAGFKVHVDLDNRIGHMSPFIMVPIRKKDRWEVRLICGGQHAADIVAKRDA